MKLLMSIKRIARFCNRSIIMSDEDGGTQAHKWQLYSIKGLTKMFYKLIVSLKGKRYFLQPNLFIAFLVVFTMWLCQI